jgi:AAA+ ATPase superfamily predicted ATPase
MKESSTKTTENQGKVIIGREYEQKKLEACFQSTRSEFIVVYGRRRIGKTYLVRNFSLSKPCVYFQVTGIQKAAPKIQLNEFSKEVANVFYGPGIKLATPKNWMDAFELLTNAMARLGADQKIILFLDELPWMAARSSQVLNTLEYYWNRHWVNNDNIKLIVCGSAASWMIHYVIKNKGGLHNRVTQRLFMETFSLKETQDYLAFMGIRYNAYQTLQIYMSLGGVSYYLSLLSKGLSAVQNINELCFQKRGTLLDEFSVLFGSLFNESQVYEDLVTLIASKTYGIERSEIEKGMNIKGGLLSKKLKDLEQAGFITSYRPWDQRKKGLSYKIIDEYLMFYLTWIAPTAENRIRGQLSSEFWTEKNKSGAWHAWAGLSFEAVCFKHIDRIRKALNIPLGSEAKVWRHTEKKLKNNIEKQRTLEIQEPQGAQIDLLFERNDEVVNICEIKFSREPFLLDKQTAYQLKQKADIYQRVTKTKKQIFLSMITTFGVKEGLYKEELIHSEMTLEDFFE